MAFTNAWDETAPLGTALRNTLDTIIQQVKLDVRERLGRTATITAVVGEISHYAIVTVTIKDYNGTIDTTTPLLVRIWLSDSQYGPAMTTYNPTVTIPDISCTAELECAGNNQYLVSPKTGSIAMTVLFDAAATFYIMVEVCGKVFASAAITVT